MSKIDQHLAICKPIKSDNQLLKSMSLHCHDLFEYQGYIAAPMIDFHSGNITALVCTDGINRISYVGGIKPKQCGFYVGSAVQANGESAALFGSEKPLIFCTDLITSLLLNAFSKIPVIFCTDPGAFVFSGASDCYVRSLNSNYLASALYFCGLSDVWFPVSGVGAGCEFKWMEAEQAAELIEVNYDHA